MTVSKRVSEYRLIVQEPDMFSPHEAVLCWLDQRDEYTYFSSMTPNGLGTPYSVKDGARDIDACIKENFLYKDRPIRMAPHAPGEYHPRIHRNGFPSSPAGLPHRASWRGAGVAARKISDLLASVFGVVEPMTRNADTCGHELRQVLLLACMEVEAAWRGVLEANLNKPPKHLTRKHYVKLSAPMRLGEWKVRLALYDDWPELSPFAGWGKQRSALGWYDAYNATKHDREGHLGQSTLRNVVDAVAALHVMMFAQFGEDALDAFGLPALTSFEVLGRPKWDVEQLYFGGRETTPVPRSLWQCSRSGGHA